MFSWHSNELGASPSGLKTNDLLDEVETKTAKVSMEFVGSRGLDEFDHCRTFAVSVLDDQ